MSSLSVIEIFHSIDGEGIRTGMPVTFIRLAGCNLRCSYCDTQYAQEATMGELMTVDEIVERVKYNAVTITGGEPLLHEHQVIELIEKLNKDGRYINIETNGSINIVPFVIPVKSGRGFFTVDYKCPCSGMEQDMCESTFAAMDESDVLKFVVSNEDDLSALRRFLMNHTWFRSTIFVSPCYGKMDLEQLVEEVKLLGLKFPKFDIRFQVQLHKIVWAPEKRGV